MYPSKVVIFHGFVRWQSDSTVEPWRPCEAFLTAVPSNKARLPQMHHLRTELNLEGWKRLFTLPLFIVKYARTISKKTKIHIHLDICHQHKYVYVCIIIYTFWYDTILWYIAYDIILSCKVAQCSHTIIYRLLLRKKLLEVCLDSGQFSQQVAAIQHGTVCSRQCHEFFPPMDTG